MKLTPITSSALFSALLISPASVLAICSSNEVDESFIAVECDNGLDPIGVRANTGVTDISVLVRSDGGIETGGDAINLNGNSVVEVSGYVSSGSGSGIYLSGAGSQQVLVNGFAEVLARNYGIYASGGQFNTEGNISITNFGLLGGPLNNGAIFASGNRTSQVQNFGEIAVSGSGYGINLSGSAGADQLTVLNRGSILAGSYGIRVHGQNALRIDNTASVDSGGYGLEARYGNDIEIINSGNLTMRGSSGYGIYADTSSGLRQEDVSIAITNSGNIVMESGTSQPRGIVAYASAGFDDNGVRYRGDVTLTNSGDITGLSAGSTGIEVAASHDAWVENDGFIEVAGLGTGIRITGGDARLINRGSIIGAQGINMTGDNGVRQPGSVLLNNSGTILASNFDAIQLRGRSVTVNNTADLTSQQRSAIYIPGLGDAEQSVSVDVFNSGRLVAAGNAIDASASSLGSSTGTVTVINEGVLLAGNRGITVTGISGIDISNRTAINSEREAIQARLTRNGDITIVNNADLTTTSGYDSIGILAERNSLTAAPNESGSVRITNSGRIQAATAGIRAIARNGNLTPLDQWKGDVEVINSGDIFTDGNAIQADADRGLASIDNQGNLAVGTSNDALLARGLNAAVTNSGAITSDGRHGILAQANGVDASIDIVNTGNILLNDKSRLGAGIQAEIIHTEGLSNQGTTRIDNSGDIVSTGFRNQAIVVASSAGTVELASNGLLSAQYDTVDMRSDNGGGDIQVTTVGNIVSTERSGMRLFSFSGGDIVVDNTANIEAFANGIQAAATVNSSVDMTNRGNITIGNASYLESVNYNGTTLISRTALYGLGNNVRIENHGQLTTTALSSSSARNGIFANSSASGGVAEVVNYGTILYDQPVVPGSNSGYGIAVSAGADGMGTVRNYGDITMTSNATGVAVFGRTNTQVQVYNDGRITANQAALSVSGQSTTTSTLVNDKSGYLTSENATALVGSAGNDHVINAGVIRTNSTSSSARAANLGSGNDIMEKIGLSEERGRVDGGAGIDTLRWGGDVLDRFDMSLVGDQYVNFEQFEKTGTSTWIYEGTSIAIDHLQVREGLARIDGELNASVRVEAGAILGGNGTINGTTTVDDGGILAPGASIGSLTLQELTMLGDNSVFELELDSGGAFDLLTVTDGALLDGVLEIIFLGTEGFEPGWRAQFLMAGQLTGSFNEYRVQGLDGLAEFELLQTTTGMELLLTHITPVPLPPTAWLLASALGLTSVVRARRSVRC